MSRQQARTMQLRHPILLWSALLAALTMAPRLTSPHFGLLDDGATLIESEATIERPTRVMHAGRETGRLRPVHDLYWAAAYVIGRKTPVVYFALNAALLIGVSALLMGILVRAGRPRIESMLAATLLVASLPAIETFYTLSKAEGLAFFLILCAVLLLTPKTPQSSLTRPRLRTFLAGFALLLATLTKETAVAAVLVATGWYIRQRVHVFGRCASGLTLRRDLFLVAAFGSFTAFTLLAVVAQAGPLGRGTYAANYSFGLSRFAENLFSSTALVLHHFPLLTLLAIAVLVWKLRPILSTSGLVLDGVVWVAGWTAVLLPWLPPLPYMLFPMAAGAAVIMATIFCACLAYVNRLHVMVRAIFFDLSLYTDRLGRH